MRVMPVSPPAAPVPLRKIARTRLVLGRQRHAGIFVTARAHVPLVEDVVLADPAERLLEHFLGVRLEDDALARAPPTGVREREEARRELVPVVVRVELGPQV